MKRKVLTKALSVLVSLTMMMSPVGVFAEEISIETMQENEVVSVGVEGEEYSITEDDTVEAASVQKYHETQVLPDVKEITPSVPFPTGNEAKATAKGDITVNKASGYAEGMYVEFAKVDGADGYVGSYKKQGASAYTELDDELIRHYPDYIRADAVGLSAGTYEFKLEAMKNDAAIATTIVTCEVTSDDRSGYAFTDGHVPGAYKADGTLKDGAVVVYVTDANFTNVKITVGSQTYTGVQDLVDDGRWKTVTKPVDIRIIGTIDGSKFPQNYLSSAEEGLQLKSDAKGKSQPLTIEGIGEDAGIKNFGMLFRGMNDVEVKNFAVMMCLDDSISINTNNKYFWVHNMDLFYGQPGSAADQKKGDGTLDLKDDSQYQTYSYNHFWDSGKCSLCGMKGESGNNYITYHHNWFDHSDSRHPRIRTMSVHVYNNYFDGNSKYGTGLAKDSNAFIESNYYRNCKYPVLAAAQGNDIYAGTADGTHKTTFSGETGGIAKTYRNIIAGECTYAPYGEKTFYKKGAVATSLFDQNVQFDAYEVSSRTETIPATVKSVAGGNAYNNFDTDRDLGVKETAIDAPADIPAIVTAKAGRLSGGDFAYEGVKHIPNYSYSGKDSNGNPCTFTQDTDYAVIDALSTKLKEYKSNLVLVGGMAKAPLVQMKKVTFEPNNGDASTEVEAALNTKMTEQAAPSKAPAGKVFAGWYIGDEKVVFPYTVTSNVTMTAKWLTQYTVTFDSNGGSAVNAQKVFEGDKAVRPADPVKSGFAFKGWMNGTESYDFSNPVTANLSLKGSWINQADVLKVDFYNGDTVFASRNVEKGAKVENVSGERKGYDFVGWYKDKACTQTFDFSSAISVATSVYGKWTKKAGESGGTYTIYWGIDGQSAAASESGIQSKEGFFTVAGHLDTNAISRVYEGKKYVKGLKLETATKVTFTTAQSNGKVIVVLSGSNNNIKVDSKKLTGNENGVVEVALPEAGTHEISKADKGDIAYIEVQDGEVNQASRTINFHFDNGTGTKSITTEDDTKTLAANIAAAKTAGKYTEPSLNDFKTAGWFTDEACTQKLADTAVIADDIDLYTYFVGSHGERIYKVQFVTNGGMLEGDSVLYAEKGQFITRPAVSHDELTFEGWYKDAAYTTEWNFAADNISGDTVIYCKWIETKADEIWTVTFNLDGHGTDYTESVIKGKQIAKPVNPVANGFKFKGWTLNGADYDFNAPVNADIELKAVWVERAAATAIIPDIFGGMEKDKVYGDGQALQFKSRVGFVAKSEKTDNALDAGGYVTSPAGIQSYSKTDVTPKIEKDGLIVYASKDAKMNLSIFAFSSTAKSKSLYFVDLGESSISSDSDIPAAAANPEKYVSKDSVNANEAFSKEYDLVEGHKYFFTLGTGGNIMISGLSYVTYDDANEPKEYTVSFDTNGGAGIFADLKVEAEDKAVKPTAEPTKDGYIFKYWSETNTETAVEYDFDTPVNGNLTLYAIYEEIKSTDINVQAAVIKAGETPVYKNYIYPEGTDVVALVSELAPNSKVISITADGAAVKENPLLVKGAKYIITIAENGEKDPEGNPNPGDNGGNGENKDPEGNPNPGDNGGNDGNGDNGENSVSNNAAEIKEKENAEKFKNQYETTEKLQSLDDNLTVQESGKKFVIKAIGSDNVKAGKYYVTLNAGTKYELNDTFTIVSANNGSELKASEKADMKQIKKIAIVKTKNGVTTLTVKALKNKGKYSLHLQNDAAGADVADVYITIENLKLPKKTSVSAGQSAKVAFTTVDNQKASMMSAKWSCGKTPVKMLTKDEAAKVENLSQITKGKVTATAYVSAETGELIVTPAAGSKGSLKFTAVMNKKKYNTTLKVN